MTAYVAVLVLCLNTCAVAHSSKPFATEADCKASISRVALSLPEQVRPRASAFCLPLDLGGFT